MYSQPKIIKNRYQTIFQCFFMGFIGEINSELNYTYIFFNDVLFETGIPPITTWHIKAPKSKLLCTSLIADISSAVSAFFITIRDSDFLTVHGVFKFVICSVACSVDPSFASVKIVASGLFFYKSRL